MYDLAINEMPLYNRVNNRPNKGQKCYNKKLISYLEI